VAGHSNIPWSKIFQYYVSSERVSYQDCCNKYHVSIQAVKEHGTAEEWVRRKKEIFKAALVLMESRTADVIAKRNTDHIALAKGLLGGAAQQLATQRYLPTNARDIKDWVIAGVDIERRALGMDVKTGPAVSVTNPQGQTVKVVWGDGSSLDDY